MRLKLADIGPPAKPENDEVPKNESAAIEKLSNDFHALVGAVNMANKDMESKIKAKQPVSYKFDFIRDEHGLLERIIATPETE